MRLEGMNHPRSRQRRGAACGRLLSRTAFRDDRLKAVAFGFGQGREVSEHTAAKPAMMIFVKSEVSIGLDDDQQEAQGNQREQEKLAERRRRAAVTIMPHGGRHVPVGGSAFDRAEPNWDRSLMTGRSRFHRRAPLSGKKELAFLWSHEIM